ncbi:LysR family transcriptional regulator [Marinomonas mediterranea]|jgi:Transcriptional regulator|uniref:Transcriptional regulator, LysR family n=1 Tax=Marinomonas mediterranea (strain ATCC 700492 / JCM 21426 / NBRC 103028 / MMB-1) TaxID=717774 RepID=F2JXY8_MARM1|nr:LysR family transcriptional regulator [Marinomonas mediterranea]ADZ89637.1 transcriptional regulator, LysR family [Marinomonas mediterranea MMB-1]WCN15876.1 LysR family transcriptional regulator [Marinomonas mediterranea MMB-1]
MTIPYNALYTFQLAVKLGSLRRTADELSLTESAVSHQLKRLETQIGRPLLTKQGRQLKPTPVGERLANRLVLPFKDIGDALSELKNTQEDLSLYVQPSLLDVWLLPKLLHFRPQYPQIRLSINYLTSAPETLSDTQLLIRSYDQDYRTSNHLFPILDGETIPVCSPLFTEINQIRSPNDLVDVTLLHDNSIDAWQNWFAQFDLHNAVRPDLVYEDFHLLKSATLAAQGVALCPTCLVKEELESGKLVQLFSDKGNQGRMYGLEFATCANSNLKLLAHCLRDK